MSKEESPKPITKLEATSILEATLSWMLQSGGVSNEKDLVEKLRIRLEKDQITPPQAVDEINKIQSSRQEDYSF